jgi:hypothetical protein
LATIPTGAALNAVARRALDLNHCGLSMISLVADDADRTDSSLDAEGFTGDQAINSNVCFALKECYVTCLLAAVQPYLVMIALFS